MIMLLIFVQLVFAFPERPNHTSLPHYCTSSDPDFKEYRYSNKTPYCSRRVLSSTRRKVYEDYAVSLSDQPLYTIDHIVPLSLGGSNHRLNLWPQHKSIGTAPLETTLWSKVNSGEMHSSEAVNLILIEKYKPGAQP